MRVARLVVLVGMLVAAGYGGYLVRGDGAVVCPPGRPHHTVEFHCTVNDPAVAGNRAVKERIEGLRNAPEGHVNAD